MKSNLLWCLLVLASPVIAPAADKAAEAKSPAPAVSAKRYPLKGVVTGILSEKSALLIKHEEIPGVMRAMTMMFKVDAATLKAAEEGQAISGLMARQGTEWWLHEAKLGAKKKG